MDLIKVRRLVGRIKRPPFSLNYGRALGALRSQFRGQGLTFKEHQQYMPGDEVRFIDWKLTAKSDQVFIKTFEEERNVEIYILLDISPSMMMGEGEISKLQAAMELMALVALCSEQNKDRVRFIIMHDKFHLLPLSKGEKAIFLFLNWLEKNQIIDKNGKVIRNFNFNKRSYEVKSILKRIPQHKEIMVFSDFESGMSLSDLQEMSRRRKVIPVCLKTSMEEKKRSPTFSQNGLFFKLLQSKTSDKQLYPKTMKFVDLKKDYLHDFLKGRNL
jgi:uncharacterized protein (DUF58 family)